MDTPYGVAFKRAAISGAILAGSGVCTMLAISHDPIVLVATAGNAFFGYLIIRGFAEGKVDSGNLTQVRADIVKAGKIEPPPDQPPMIG